MILALCLVLSRSFRFAGLEGPSSGTWTAAANSPVLACFGEIVVPSMGWESVQDKGSDDDRPTGMPSSVVCLGEVVVAGLNAATSGDRLAEVGGAWGAWSTLPLPTWVGWSEGKPGV